jgi:NADH-quinone oxidoreductase chain G
MITVTINDKKITVAKPVTILQAARIAGIEIPTLCNHDLLEAFGGCRLCLVEVEKMPRLQTACTQYITDGMVVRTETEQVVQARKAMLEFLLINHPLECPVCDKAGECDLQDTVMKYGPPTGRFAEGKRTHPESYEDPIIVRNMDRCISCTRCVRMCDRVQGASAISMTNRSGKTFVEPFSGKRFDCEYCGGCITVCPVGALMSRLHKHTYRPWYIDREIDTICSYCGVGCSMTAQMRGDSLVRVIPKQTGEVNKGLLCNRGYFGYDYITNKDRLRKPLIRKNGRLQEASWSEALQYVANKLKEIKEKNGAGAIGGIAGGRCTNEDGYALQKLMRVVLGSSNIDSTAGRSYAYMRKYFENIFGQGAALNPMHGIANADGIFAVGGDPTAINPVLGLQIRSAFRKGIPVIAAGYMPGLKRFASQSLNFSAFTEATLLNALVSELMTKRPACGENQDFEKAIKEIKPLSFKDAENICGVAAEATEGAVSELVMMTNPAFIIGGDIIGRSDADAILTLLSALAYLVNGRIYLLPEKPNEAGLFEMGCLPDMLPGARPLNIEIFRHRYEEACGCSLPLETGLKTAEMIEAANDGRIKALYVMGENPALNLPDSGFVRGALSKLDLLVVQDIFLSETAQLAHVVLPSLSWAEKEGSYTNLEGRIQYMPKVIDNLECKEDWRIIAEIAGLLGFEMKYKGAADVFSEIAEVSPLHKGLTYGDMSKGKCLWPYKGEPLRHDVHHEEDFKFHISNFKSDDNIYLCMDKPLFHSGSLSRNSKALNGILNEPYAKMSKKLADKFGISAGDTVRISSDKGSLDLQAALDEDIPDNIVLVPNNFSDRACSALMKWNSYRTAIKITKV